MVSASFNVKGSNKRYEGDRVTYKTLEGEQFTLGTVNRNKKADPSILLVGESSVNVTNGITRYANNHTDVDYKYDYSNYQNCPQYAAMDGRKYNDTEELQLDLKGAELLKQIVDTDKTDGENVLSENDIFQFIKNFKDSASDFVNRIKNAGLELLDTRYDSNNGVYTVDYVGDDGTKKCLSFDYNKGKNDKSVGSVTQPYEEIHSTYLHNPRTPEHAWEG